jgi:hypothetical protein
MSSRVGTGMLLTDKTKIKQNKLKFHLRHHIDNDTWWFEGATTFTHC